MLNKDLITHNIPYLAYGDTVDRALRLMGDFHVTHLPLVDDNKFIGILSEDDLLDAEDSSQTLESQFRHFIKMSVHASDYFTTALRLAAEADLSLVPVLEAEEEMAGTIVSADLVKIASRAIGATEAGGLIVLEMERTDYAPGELSRLVESHDATITQLNTVSDPASGMLLVSIRVNKQEISDLIATLQRFDYQVRYYFGEELYENELRSNYENLMNYLGI